MLFLEVNVAFCDIQCVMVLKDTGCNWVVACADQDGGQGPDPLKNHKNIGLNGVSLAGRYWPAVSGIRILSPIKTNTKNVSAAVLDPL